MGDGKQRRPLDTSKTIPSPSIPLDQEDIRLCTIIRTDAQDTLGFELHYHRREQFHTLNIIPGRKDEPSSKIFVTKNTRYNSYQAVFFCVRSN
jgi:hypothetical protein